MSDIENDDFEDWNDEEFVSKTTLKKEMLALQKLGESIAKLPDKELAPLLRKE